MSSRDESWTVLRLWGPGPAGLRIDPPELPELLGFPSSEGISSMKYHERTLFFLDRGAGVVRVMRVSADMKLFEREMAYDRVIGRTIINQYHACELPAKVMEHLQMRSFEHGTRHAYKATNDSVAWVVPAADYREWRKAKAANEQAGSRRLNPVLESLRPKRGKSQAPAAPTPLPVVPVYLARMYLPTTPDVG